MRAVPISAQRPAAAPADTSGELHLFQILTTLRRGKWWILFYTIAAILLGGYYAFNMTTPLYKSSATVALQSRFSQVVDLTSPVGNLTGDFYTINTEVLALQSRDLIEKLVDKMDLTNDPVFNVELRPPEPEKFSPIGTLRAGVGLLLSIVRPAPGPTVAAPELTEEEKQALLRENVVNAVRETINVENVMSSYVFKITVTSEYPEATRRIANGLAELYIEEQIAVKYEATERATKWLTTRVNELRAELEITENAVKSFTADADLVAPEMLEGLNRQLKDRRDRTASVEAKAEEAAARVAALTAARDGDDVAAMAEIANDPALTQLVARISDADARRTFDARFDQILKRAELEASRGTVQAAALRESIGDLEIQVASQSTELLKLEQLEREAAATRQLYEYFLGRLKETSAQQGVHEADSRIMSKAIQPRFPVSPRKGLILIMATFMGFIIGCIAVLVQEIRRRGFRSAQELEQATGYNVFAQIPRAPFTQRRRVLNYLSSRPSSAMMEAVRNLRTSILLSNMDHPPQVIMMSSSLPAEGKTTQSLALAQSFSKMGKRVLLIEGDIRRRTFQQYFKTRRQRGLIAAVSGEYPLEEIMFHSEDVGADVLMGEKSTVNAADFFSSEKFRSFLDQIRAHYEVIIIDTPPVMIVPDARVIGRMVDAVIYVVHWGKTTAAQVQEGLHALESVDVKVSGLSFSQVDYRKARSYGGVYSEVYSGYGSKYYKN